MFGRVEYDDHWLWADDSPLRSCSLATLSDIWFQLDAKARHALGSEYLPVRDVVVMIDMAIWGDGERGPHLTQLVIYAASVWSLGTLLVRFGFTKPVAWVATLLWAVHPMHVESVAWLSERKGVLSALFVFLCGHAWVRYREGRSVAWLVAAALAAVAGVWSKAPAMFAPAVFAAWDLLVLPANRRRWIAIGVVGAAAALAAMPVIAVASGARIIDEQYTADASRFVRALGAQGHYLEAFVLAKKPSIAYPSQTLGPSAIDLVIGALAVIGSALLAWRWRGSRQRLAVLAWAWIWFVPISHLAIPVHIVVADRFAFLWILGACLGLAMLVERLQPTWRLVATGALVAAFGVVALRAEGAWTNSLELYARAYASNPRDWRHCDNYATQLLRDGQQKAALAIADACLARDPKHGYLLDLKARLLDATGRGDEALAVSAAAAESGKSSVMWKYAIRLRERGRAAEALPWIERAVKNQPAIASYRVVHGGILVDLGKYAEAEATLREAIRLEPTPLAGLLMAKSLVELGRRGEIEPYLVLAARDPSLAPQVAMLRGN